MITMPKATERPVPRSQTMEILCEPHGIPLGWAHCRCGLVPLEGANWCNCPDHKAVVLRSRNA